MSLKSFVAMPEVKAKIKPLRPKLPRTIGVPLKIEPGSNRYTMVGTAFDYLLRFELQRRAPRAVIRRWVAESVADEIWEGDDYETRSFLHMSRDDQGVVSVLTGPDTGIQADEQLAKEVAGKVRDVVDKAKSALAAYLKKKSPSRRDQTDLAAHAIRLAKLDPLVRASQFDPSFEMAAVEDVADLLCMLDIVTFDLLIHRKILLLNPTFEHSSVLVGGADADLIAGDLLVDFKVTKKGEISVTDLDQLLGYYFLCRNERRLDPHFPEVKWMGLYFCRHGYLWTLDATKWTEHPQFAETEEWFFDRAKEVQPVIVFRQKPTA